MPIVYACLCPPVLEQDAARTEEALERIAEELALSDAACAVVIVGPAGTAGRAIGVGAGATGDRATAEARGAAVPVEVLRRWEAPPVLASLGLDTKELLPVRTGALAPGLHFELGRALGRALAADERRWALVCIVTLAGPSDTHRPALFDRQFRQAIEGWSVKWLVGVERPLRLMAGEDAVAQTAVLMGALSESKIQPRVLSYEAPAGVGSMVAAIDVLGPRRKRAAAGGLDG
jgi:hypothetical protein